MNRTFRTVAFRARPLVATLAMPLWLACSSTEGDDSMGGSAGTAASPAGGTSAGTSTSGGAAGASGSGATSTGGAGTAGASSGGAGVAGSAAGSVSGGSAGSSGDGGTLSGGASSGGTGGGGESAGGASGQGSGGTLSGGASGAGGDSGGTAGTSNGGSSGDAGTAGTGGTTETGSPGCGSASPLSSGTFMVNIDGTNRKWMVDVPNGYDPDTKYKLIFVWHPLSGSGSQVANGGYNGLKSLSNGTAVFATADGLQGSNAEASGTGWWNANGGDMKLVQAMLDAINEGLCIDQERIFSTGFSFGGMMSYTVGFEFDVFRAVAPCSGKTGVIPYETNNTAPLPIMAFHGDSDTFVQTALGKEFLDKYAERNNCGTETQPVSPNGCVQYQGCDAPTTWCLFSGGHVTWSEQPAAIWSFFSQF